VQHSVLIGFTLVSIDSLHLVPMEMPEAVKFNRGVSMRMPEAPARSRCFSRIARRLRAQGRRGFSGPPKVHWGACFLALRPFLLGIWLSC
jgi:hypothetical protein